MRRIYAKHLPYMDGHLGKVAADMELAGAPTIRCMEIDGDFYALEGSHRLACAHRYGEEPKLVVCEPELNADRDGYWQKVSQTLPAYDFPHVHVLRLNSFNRMNRFEWGLKQQDKRAARDMLRAGRSYEFVRQVFGLRRKALQTTKSAIMHELYHGKGTNHGATGLASLLR